MAAALNQVVGGLSELKNIMDAIYLTGAAIVAAVVFGVYWISVTYSAYDGRPKLDQDEIIYNESFASGCCALNAFTRLFWAVGWTRLIVTRNLLVMTSWFPMVLLSALWDIEHVIRFSQITSLESHTSNCNYVRIVYTDRKGRTRIVGIRPMDEAALLVILKNGTLS